MQEKKINSLQLKKMCEHIGKYVYRLTQYEIIYVEILDQQNKIRKVELDGGYKVTASSGNVTISNPDSSLTFEILKNEVSVYFENQEYNLKLVSDELKKIPKRNKYVFRGKPKKLILHFISSGHTHDTNIYVYEYNEK